MALFRRRNLLDLSKLHWPSSYSKVEIREALPEPIPQQRPATTPTAGVQTLVSIIYVTQSKTFDGPATYVTLGSPLPKIPGASTITGDSAPRITAPATQTTAGAARTSNTSEESTSTGTTLPAASATSSVVPQPGMSSGVKAALVLGLLIGLALLLGFVLWFMKGRKRRQAMRRLADEKHGYHQAGIRSTVFRPVTPSVNNNSSPPSIIVEQPAQQKAATADTAPRLSLRPVTQFSPNLSDEKGNPNASPRNAANDPSNPFGNHAETFENQNARRPAEMAGALPPGAAGPPGFRADDPASPKPLSVRPNGPNDMPPTEMHNGQPAMPAPVFAAPPPRSMQQQQIPPPPPGSNNVHRVQMDFTPSMEDELRIRAGQLVRMLHEYDDGWVCEQTLK